MAWPQLIQCERAFSNPNKTAYVIAQQARNVTYLAIAAFAHHHPNPRAVGGPLQYFDPRRHRQLAVKLDALTPAAQIFGGRGAIKQHPILFFDLKARMCQPKCQVAVVGQQDQPFAIGIQPTNRKEPLIARHQSHNGGPAMRVIRR